MINVSTFFKPDATEQWFNVPAVSSGGLSVHEMLRERGYNIIDRNTLQSGYADLHAPINMVDLSYAPSIAVPAPGYENTFVSGYAWEVRKLDLDGAPLTDTLDKWLLAMPGRRKYVISLAPETFLCVETESVTFQDIFAITRNWSINCSIGIFNDSSKVMFVFGEEFGLIYAGFHPDHVPEEFDKVSSIFEKVIERGYVEDSWDRGVGQRHRLEEFFEQVVKPYI